MTAPTNETVEDRIIENVRATLAAISPQSTAESYWTTVKRVHVRDIEPLLAAVGEVPAVVVIYEACVPADGPTGVLAQDLQLQLHLCLSKANSNWKRDLSRFAADVKRALLLDAGRGTLDDQPNAFDTTVSELRQANAPEESGLVMARVDVSIHFRHLPNDPTAAA